MILKSDMPYTNVNYRKLCKKKKIRKANKNGIVQFNLRVRVFSQLWSQTCSALVNWTAIWLISPRASQQRTCWEERTTVSCHWERQTCLLESWEVSSLPSTTASLHPATLHPRSASILTLCRWITCLQPPTETLKGKTKLSSPISITDNEGIAVY